MRVRIGAKDKEGWEMIKLGVLPVHAHDSSPFHSTFHPRLLTTMTRERNRQEVKVRWERVREMRLRDLNEGERKMSRVAMNRKWGEKRKQREGWGRMEVSRAVATPSHPYSSLGWVRQILPPYMIGYEANGTMAAIVVPRCPPLNETTWTYISIIMLGLQ